MTEIKEDQGLIVHLDFDPDLACESKWSTGEEAEWHVTMLCCGRNLMFCTPHKERTKKYNESHDNAFCLACNAPTGRGKGMRFTPLK